MLDLEKIRDVVLELLKPYGVKRLAIFGSVARGEETLESDIDLLVRLENPPRKPLGLAWFGLAEELSERLGRKVDLATEEELSPYVWPHVKEDLIILYEQGEPTMELYLGRREQGGSTMRKPKDDRVYLLHIRDAIARLVRYTAGVSYEQFSQDEGLQDMVIRPLQIIGEASRNLSESSRQEHAEIPWGKIIGFRNRIVHNYFDLNLKTIWRILQEEIPLLRSQILRMLDKEEAC